ncbi:MAG TPA: PhoPQ-activated pathogenicity-related family protein [Verrucomicrobiota bacterium]|nr:PhoPQ-activated pathogenicity-related family protein [Verrucomicrobiota bacterium]HNU52194.1 PhoPQ-activated pathogenicity-related family protein [Verrucomicrobiota bacterium]
MGSRTWLDLRRASLGIGLLLLASGCASPQGTSRKLETALDRYVAAPDTNYSWRVASSERVADVTVTVIDLTSQSWLTPAEVNQTLWRHWLVVARPDHVEHATGLLFIGGGNNKDSRLPKPPEQLLHVAKATKSVVAELRMVPNQPLVFMNDGRERVEDDLIAYTWDRFLRTGDERWPARLPMTKAAVRAMDTMTAFCAGAEGGGVPVTTFVVAGGSKRGWTTWTTAIVDRRVVAICPIVIDLLNLVPSFEHHYRVYGFFAPAVQDYVDAGIMDWMGTPEFGTLLDLVEPYQYRDRLTMPKLMLNACGDQFFLPDSSQFYFKDLKGPKYLRYVPNTDHSMKKSDSWETLLAWYHMQLHKTPLPRFTWRAQGPNTLRVETVDRPVAVRLWQATNPSARDFRLDTLGPAWTSEALADQGGGVYIGRVEPPAQGWKAYGVELTYDVGAPAPFKVTTEIRVTPDALPYGPYQPKPRTISR